MSINKSCVPSIGNVLLSQLILGRLKSPVNIVVFVRISKVSKDTIYLMK